MAGLPDTEETASVAVIDSIYDPGDGFFEKTNVGRMVDLLPPDQVPENSARVDVLSGVEDDTTGHGSIVTAILLAAAYNIEFYFYRVTQRSENAPILQRHFQNALGMAHLEHEVDIINLSIGNDHSTDGNRYCNTGRQPCKIHEAAQKAINDGISIVAAAGNCQQFDSISCPAFDDDVICVGGFASECHARLNSNRSMDPLQSIEKPPNACWIERTDERGTDMVLCSGQGCSPIHSCDENRKNVSWDGNVAATENKPDVLGPVAIPVHWGVPTLTTGTSWATPFVTATAAEILAAVRDRGEDATPQQLRRGIAESATPLDDGGNKLFCSVDSWYYVFDLLGLPRPDFDRD